MKASPNPACAALRCAATSVSGDMKTRMTEPPSQTVIGPRPLVIKAKDEGFVTLKQFVTEVHAYLNELTVSLRPTLRLASMNSIGPPIYVTLDTMKINVKAVKSLEWSTHRSS
ncbi:hypothetical protein DM02DRAFT_661848 [Periconia macrospinosa]|uniref:Uncharacterized protein n=1 Tax=Periconia macrospinosa TaxID=97972 RepID=A0A2V1D687_9PLEO|nr:hypothetical protein DM02DRAFT_661848 [Periconia macrospinosa]